MRGGTSGGQGRAAAAAEAAACGAGGCECGRAAVAETLAEVAAACEAAVGNSMAAARGGRGRHGTGAAYQAGDNAAWNEGGVRGGAGMARLQQRVGQLQQRGRRRADREGDSLKLKVVTPVRPP